MMFKKILFFSFLILIPTSVFAGLFNWQSPFNARLGAPTATFQQNIYPFTDNTYDIGTSTRRFRHVHSTFSSSTIQSISSLIQFTEIATPANPPTDDGKLYIKDDGSGTTRIFLLDSAGIETDLTGGGGGCTTLDCLTDVTISSPIASSTLTYNGTDWVNYLLNFNDILRGFATSTQGGTGYSTSTLGDLLYGGSTNNWLKLGIGSSGKFLTVSGGVPAWGDAVDLTTNQNVGGVKTFTIPPESTLDATTTAQLVRFGQLSGLGLGQFYHEAVRAATTTPITLSGTQTIDGIAVVAGDRVLAAGQVATSSNGAYAVAAGAWSRTSDYDQASEVTLGSSFPVSSGVVNNGSIFIMSTTSVVTLGTDPITFTKFTPPVYTGGDGITVTGTVIDADIKASDGLEFDTGELTVDYDDATLGMVSTKLSVKTGGITATQLANGSVVLTSADVTGTLPVANGGTNLTASLDDNVMVGNGTTWQSKAVTDCDGATNAVTYDVTLNAFGCNALAVSGGNAAATTTAEVIIFGNNSSTRTWTNMPVAATELFGATDTRKRIDLTYATQYRVKARVNTVGAAGADLNLRYTTASTTAFASTLTADSGGAGEVAISGTTGLREGSWTNLVAGAKNDVYILIAGKDGNAVADPIFSQIVVEFRYAVGTQGADTASAFVTVGNDGNLSAERSIGVGNSLSLTDNGANSTIVLDLSTTTPTFSSLTITGLATSTFTGGASFGGLASSNGLTITGGSIRTTFAATSTFAGGLDILSGCFAINGACIGPGGGGGTIGGSGAAGQAAYFTAGSTIAGNNNFFWDTTNFRLGIGGTTTPWGTLSIMQDTVNPLISVATSTGSNPLLLLYATSTGRSSLARLAIGTTSAWGNAGILDQLVVEGRSYTTARYSSCDHAGIGLPNALLSKLHAVCGPFAFIDDSDSSLSAQTDGIPTTMRLSAGVVSITAGDGAAVGTFAEVTAATSSPVWETWVRIPTSNINAIYLSGFGVYAATPEFAAEPTDGYYFVASSTATGGASNNWLAVARANSVSTVVNTGVATSSTEYQKLRVEATPSLVRYIINGRIVASITTNITSATVGPKVHLGVLTGALGAIRTIDISLIRFWSQD